MTTSGTQLTAAPDADFTKTWRYKVGLFMFIAGNLGIPGAAVLGLLGFGTATVGTFAAGGEILAWTSIVFLGMQGFKTLERKVTGFFKASYTASVGRTRHYIGITLLLTNVVTTYIMMIYAWDAFATASAKGPAAAVWGLDIAQQGDLVFWLFLAGELAFLFAIYVLGADWWGKFRRIFVWEGAAD
jgi:hypothetical protein